MVPRRAFTTRRAAGSLAITLSLLRCVGWAAEGFDLGPLDVGMQLLKVSERDLRVKPDYVEDQVGGGSLRLPFVTDGLRGAAGAAARSRQLGQELTGPPDLAATVETLSALLGEGRVPVEPAPELLEPQAPLPPELPLPLRQALAELIHGVARADDLFGRAFRDLTPEDVALLEDVLPGVLTGKRTPDDVIRGLRVAAGLDMRAVVSATAALTSSVCKARELLADLPQGPQCAPFVQETALGRIVVAGPEADVHTVPAAILIDLGDKDRYEIAPTETVPAPRVSVVIDLGGDDTYAPPVAFGPSAALLGLSVLVDEAGNDEYTAREPYAFGAALVGAGLLVDAEGDDRYMGVVFGEGAAMFGLGMLLDCAGDDSYGAELHAQGCGSVKGVGALVDLAGTDRYQAGRTVTVSGASGERVLACAQGFGTGVRQVAPGGFGVLADAGGADIYTADTFSQGAGWWYGGGLLYDGGGDDQYQGGQYSQGAGGFMAVGSLLDEAGNDRYSAAERGQGFGFERGIGLLRDASGEDGYATDRLAQGAAVSSGIGIALDLAGEDAYLCRESGQGFVPRGEALGTLALFGDGGGKDSYTGPDRNDFLWSDGSLALGIDTDQGDLTLMRASLPATTGRIGLAFRQPTGQIDLMPTPGGAAAEDLDTLWAAVLEAQEPRAAREARRALVGEGEQAARFLAAKLSDPDEGAIRVAQEALEEIGTPAVPELLRLMDEGADREARAAMAVLSMIGDPRAAGHLARQAKSPRWRTRAAAAGGMAALDGEEDTRLVLEELLRDPDEDVRRSAVVALRRRGEMGSADAIAGLLGDPVYAVREVAAEALVALVTLGARCPQHVFSLVGTDQPDVRLLSIETCGRLGAPRAGNQQPLEAEMLIRLLESPEWADRAFAAEAICRIGDEQACDALRAMLAEETNGLVQAKARIAMKATRLCEP